MARLFTVAALLLGITTACDGITTTDDDKTTDTGAAEGSCAVFCGFVQDASPSQETCVDDEFSGLGYDTTSVACQTLADTEASCLSCMVTIAASDEDCTDVTATCVTQ
ncbi:MAG: hypothetical protein KTR31_23120 [Myxococcales bacterium]|nr:hypothetical protein [Myxococcales bacterium]